MMNLQKMLKQAQDMQQKLQDMQQEMEAKEYDGTAGGGMVTVTLTGKGKMVRLAVDPSLVDPEDKEVLEDLIVAAHNDAKTKADDAMAGAMNDMTGGMQMPPGFKMPF